MTSSARQLGLLTGWQTIASTCFYALFAGTALLSDAIGLSRFQVGLVVTAGTLGYTVALFPVGAVVDGAGEKPVLVGGLLALALGVVAVGLAGSYYPLLAAACVLGAAYATAMPATNRAIVTTIPAAIRGRAMGIKQVGVTGGSGVAAVLVVSFAPSVGAWNLGFLLVGGLAVAVALLFALGYSGTPGANIPLSFFVKGTNSPPSPNTTEGRTITQSSEESRTISSARPFERM